MVTMTTFEAHTDIAAPTSRVWDRLLEVTAWPTWDTSLERVHGTLAPGGRVTIHVTDQPRAFPLRVTGFEPGHRLVLRGGMPLGLFSGTRRYALDPLPGGGTSFRMTETYGGALAPLVTRSIPDLQPSFEAFVAGLRRDAETASPHDPQREDHR